MYKRFYIAVLIVLALASCTKEVVPTRTEVQFLATVNPEIFTGAGITKAGSAEEIIADYAILQAWKGDIRVANAGQPITPGTTQINFSGVRLVEGEQYDIYIWVGCDGYYNTDDLRIVTLKDDKTCDGKSHQFDAFFAYTSVTCSKNEVIHPVSLKRPFAKLNFSAPVGSAATISFTAPTGLDLKTGKVLSPTKNINYSIPPVGSKVTAFDYIFADEGVTDMDYTFKLGDEEAKTTTIPVSRNKITNIIYKVTE